MNLGGLRQVPAVLPRYPFDRLLGGTHRYSGVGGRGGGHLGCTRRRKTQAVKAVHWRDIKRIAWRLDVRDLFGTDIIVTNILIKLQHKTLIFSHIHTELLLLLLLPLRLDTVKGLYSPNDAQMTALKAILQLTRKQLRHVSVQSRHHQGAHYACLLKLQLLK